MERFDFQAGQFVSLVAMKDDKQQTRAYSLASSARGNNSFDLCLNRVDDGFFSNLLCDLKENGELDFHGPHGMFVLRNPVRDSILVATGTGIAPMRGFVEYLFGGDSDRSDGKAIHLVYGTRHETEIYYREYFENIARKFVNFHYTITLSKPAESWQGERGYVQDQVKKIIEARPVETRNSIDAYICGLNCMVSANRKLLTEMGWERKQIVFERYD
jgi:NAD(P)H-flavin reductase